MKKQTDSIFRFFCIITLIFFTGCATGVDVKDDKQLIALFQTLAKNKKTMADKKKQKEESHIKKLDIIKAESGFTVSAELEDAQIITVVKRMLEITKEPYLFDNINIYGNVTLAFNNLPFIEALNAILGSNGISARKEGKCIVLSNKLKDEKSVSKENVYAELILNNLDATTAITLLSGLFGSGGGLPAGAGVPGAESAAAGVGSGSPSPSLAFGQNSASNAIYIRGIKYDVEKAVQFIKKADKKIKHVVIEVLVVEFSTQDLVNLGSKIKDLQTGQLKGINTDFSISAIQNIGDIITFTRPEDRIKYPTAFSAAVTYLIGDEKARLISRPYIATISGKKAQIEIAREGYMVSTTLGGGVTAQSLKSGVILNILPVIIDDGKLNMEVSVEDSQFVGLPPVGLQAAIDKNAAKTFMQVEDGQTIIIGGLVLNRNTWNNNGFPFLRKVPIVNLVTANQRSDHTEKEVAIYITPHIWDPDIKSPLLDPEALSDTDTGVKKIGNDISSIIKKIR